MGSTGAQGGPPMTRDEVLATSAISTKGGRTLKYYRRRVDATTHGFRKCV